jgi:hypothetical protein
MNQPGDQNKPNTPAGYGDPVPQEGERPSPPQQGLPGDYGHVPDAGNHPPGYPPPHQYDPQYGPPPRQGKPAWFWVLIGCGGLFAVFVIFAILALAAIPLITTNTQQARKSEGESMLGSMRNSARVAFMRNGEPPRTLTGDFIAGGAEVNPAELVGNFYEVEDRIGAPSPGYGALRARPLAGTYDPIGTMEFHWQDGTYSIDWE